MHAYRTELMGMPLDAGLDSAETVSELARGGVLLSYLNPFAWKVKTQDVEYLEHLGAMDMVVCDGIAIQRAARRLLGKDLPIVSLDYSGIAPRYLKGFQDRGSRVCLVGGREDQLDLVSRRLKEQYPGLNLLSSFSGYGSGPDSAREFILEAQPEVVLAGMGMGRQEAFLVSLRKEGWNETGIAVGAFFDRIARPRHDYPAWSKKFNVRFLGNITRRPFYYLRRYGVDYLPFLKQYVSHTVGRRSKRK